MDALYARGVREELDELLRDRTLVVVAFAVAGGWSLLQTRSS